MSSQKRHYIRTFFRTFFLSLVMLILVVAAGYFSYGYLTKDSSKSNMINKQIDSNLKKGSDFLANVFTSVPERTNFVILGTDTDGTRTDVMIVGCFNTKTKKLDLISIPRDTYTVMPQERLNVLKEHGINTASDSGVMKMNEVHHHAGKEYGRSFLVKQLEDLLGIKLEYYVEMDLDAFKYIVDAIGGVEFDVPQRMYYVDPTQGLKIDLQPGMQTLNGEAAEGLIRYRKSDPTNPMSKGYAMGDLDRINVQHDFMKELFRQVISKETILNNAPSMISAGLKYMDTNFNIGDMTKYLKYVKDFGSEDIQTYTLPCTPQKVNGKDFVVENESESAELVNRIFFSSEAFVEQMQSSKDKSMIVLNGGYTSGLAAQTKSKLEADGFTVAKINDFKGTKEASTRIIVKEEGQGKDLQQYFTDSKIKIDPAYDLEHDIVIILGTLE